MDKSQLQVLFYLVTFVVPIFGTVWLVKRAKPEKRIYWFVGGCIVSTLWLGLIQAPVAIVSIVGFLGLLKKEDDRPLSDIGAGLVTIFSSGLGILLFGLYMLGSVGGLYWLWLAIQLKSFSMFLVGVFPLSWLVTSPVGAYSLVFGTPQWVTNYFGG